MGVLFFHEYFKREPTTTPYFLTIIMNVFVKTISCFFMVHHIPLKSTKLFILRHPDSCIKM